MQVLILGATGGTGRWLVTRAIDQGHTVTALVRNPANVQLQHDRLKLIKGDVNNQSVLVEALDGQEAVISTLGKGFKPRDLLETNKPVNFYSASAANIIKAMEKAGVNRFIGLTSIATNPEFAKTGLANQAFYLVLKQAFLDMGRMEEAVKASSLDWTIVRPSRLSNKPPKWNYKISSGYKLDTDMVSRTDLSGFLLDLLKDNNYINKAVSIGN